MELDELRKLQREVQGAAREFEQIGDDCRAATCRPACATSSASSTTRAAAPARGRRRDRRRRPARSSSPPLERRPRRRRAGAPGRAARLRQDLSANSVPTHASRRTRRATRVQPAPLGDERTPDRAGNVHVAPDRAAHAAACARSSPSSSSSSCLFPFAKDIYALLAQPLLRVLPQGSTMIATDVTGTFLVPLKVTLMAAFLIALPFVLWQAWAFVAPGLYQHEKRLVAARARVELPVLRCSGCRSRISSSFPSRSDSSPATRRSACR